MKGVRFPDRIKPLLVPIDQIHQHPDNPNNGDVDDVIESIQKSGFVTVITADSRTGNIIAGHTRYAALLALGSDVAPVLWVDHWDKDEALTYLVGDNEIARRARMNKRELVDLLVYLRTTERGLEGTGHTEDTLYRLMQEVLQDDNPIGQVPGFAGNVAPNGIFQLVIDFESAEERDEAYEALDYLGRGGVMRKVNL